MQKFNGDSLTALYWNVRGKIILIKFQMPLDNNNKK